MLVVLPKVDLKINKDQFTWQHPIVRRISQGLGELMTKVIINILLYFSSDI